MTSRLTEPEDTGPRAGGRINLIDKTMIKLLNATGKKIKFNTKSITYSESTSKIMVRSLWTVFKILLVISAWDFMEECLTISLSTEWLKMY